ncbi:MAG: hypothetical protein GY765_11560 [bacterium]|nr:hypothetical protein [bacterium]
MASYANLDANLRFSNLFKKGYYLNIRCSNLLDTKYMYPTSTNNSLWADKGTPGHLRSLLVTLGKEFK